MMLGEQGQPQSCVHSGSFSTTEQILKFFLWKTLLLCQRSIQCICWLYFYAPFACQIYSVDNYNIKWSFVLSPPLSRVLLQLQIFTLKTILHCASWILLSPLSPLLFFPHPTLSLLFQMHWEEAIWKFGIPCPQNSEGNVFVASTI